MFGVYLDKKMTAISDYVKALKTNTLTGLHTSPDRCKLRGNERLTLPVDIRDARDRSTHRDIWEFLSR
jgi:hypothetical protein